MKSSRNIGRVRRKIKSSNIIVSHIENNLREYLIVSIIFIIGILIGIVFVNNLSDVEYKETSNYITSFINSLKNQGNMTESIILKNSLFNNLSIGILLWILSSTVIGLIIVYIIICFKGFCFGFTISSLVSVLGIKNGVIFIFASMLLQSIIAIPCIIALGVSGTRLYKAIMKDREIHNIKLELIRHTIFSIFVFILLIFSSILEAYISKNLLIYFIRYL